MPPAVLAVVLGILLSLTNFAVSVGLSATAMKRKTTTAAAITVASFIGRLTVLFFALLYLAHSPVWRGQIYLTAIGLIAAHLLLMTAEIIVLGWLEGRLGLREGVLEG